MVVILLLGVFLLNQIYKLETTFFFLVAEISTNFGASSPMIKTSDIILRPLSFFDTSTADIWEFSTISLITYCSFIPTSTPSIASFLPIRALDISKFYFKSSKLFSWI
ncbi:hypothetical protein [Fibrobacter sp. UWT3]|uniref:hypothetical protein n=1 Tax=Fibrobacter sp. UWT3 TaxID=1896225 RepID=UPI000BE2DA0E|nr:hypothetical protein [Fibrobacter sp. UWT3]